MKKAKARIIARRECQKLIEKGITLTQKGAIDYHTSHIGSPETQKKFLQYCKKNGILIDEKTNKDN